MKLCLLFVYNKNNMEDGQNIPLTIVNNKKEFNEFVYKHICVRNYEHFNSWAELHDKDPSLDKNILEYSLTIHEEEFKNYVAKKLYFKPEATAAVFRMFNKCLPVDASYETRIEHTYMNKVLQQMLKKESDKEKKEYK